jgi:hypothetical protein
MRLGCLLYGQVVLAPKTKSPGSEEWHRLIDGFGCTVGRAYRKDNAKLGGIRIREGDDPRRPSGKVDGVGEATPSGRVEHGIDRWDDLAYPDGQIRSVVDGDGAEVADQMVPLRR